ncbi:serine/threonine kinase 16 [Fusarium oxysporum f. sp. lycopersici 4287]|uniref:Serine/threonine kinase 16 n=1 Tax=Fusarium oxysporum f. sp. lycopersici (strain 4287 / CBS 123668 / FGSC 9935 / NRRL 34936) TaxID=426428 RepID=A0A0J9W8V9_FUSO4|nr:serine/threonine kinase 16 [Fusarium oxysporum f. sp. lycopersici 4287]EWZ77485.1 serine/threonine kinase 16 [Fusarium oxysporum f. sp. lycopersici MN25]KAJ9413756.1 serine/threonine kinase [Fusarium oxysporum]KNB19253.1 serine/threonine kinase 16 [Fusarium oxysporum f. sp. lycopersici 4287]
MNATASVVLSGTPYNFAASKVGLSYLSPLVGTLLAALYTGRFSDWFTIRLARRNQGVMEAEQRLWPFLLCVILIPASLILWGVGAAHNIHWFGLLVAMCGLGFINAVGITLSVNYLIDSYYHISGDALSTVMIIRNSMAFGMGYAITPWFENMGFQNCFLVAAFVGMLVAASFLAIVKYGKRLRARSTEAYWKLVDSDVVSSH